MARRDRGEVAERDAGLSERVGDDRADELDVRAARDLGHHTTEARVQIDLARHDRRQHRAPVHDDRGRRLVARRLDTQDCLVLVLDLVDPNPYQRFGSS